MDMSSDDRELPPGTESILPKRQRRLPKRYRDLLPAPPAPLPPEPLRETRLPRVVLNVWERVCTPQNIFGLWREYLGRPSYVPDTALPEDEWALGVKASPATHPKPGSEGYRSSFWPFPNISQFLLGNWYINSPSRERSGRDFDSLLHVIQDPRFDPTELARFSHRQLHHVLDSIDNGAEILPGELNGLDGWKRNTSVTIQVPEGKKWWTCAKGKSFQIPGLHHRSICSIVRKVYSTATDLHFTPFEWYHQPLDSAMPKQRVWGDLFCSQAWLDEHRALPREPGCQLERVVAPLMFWSDSTHLANFGTAKLWPIYMFFGSQNKYTRSKPSSHLCHHLAYIPSVCDMPICDTGCSLMNRFKLPDSIQDFIRTLTGGVAARPALLTHCRRELMHAIWQLLLDEEFMEAYKHGIIIKCTDGICRRVFPRIFTYSADYPEKSVLSAPNSTLNSPMDAGYY
jgi:Plavaka transposase